MNASIKRPAIKGSTAKAAAGVTLAGQTGGVFKTKSFARDASAASITDRELCQAITEVELGQAVDLGGGVWKKRLSNNEYRSLILAKGNGNWIYSYLFAKSSRANIKRDELQAFREAAQAYRKLSEAKFKEALDAGKLVEICHECKQKET
jgi:hypothetical protein